MPTVPAGSSSAAAPLSRYPSTHPFVIMNPSAPYSRLACIAGGSDRNPQSFSVDGRTTLSSRPHPSNASSPILVTPSGMTSVANRPHPSKACSPMDFIPSWIATIVSFPHPANAESPMPVTGYPPNFVGTITAPVVVVGMAGALSTAFPSTRE